MHISQRKSNEVLRRMKKKEIINQEGTYAVESATSIDRTSLYALIDNVRQRTREIWAENLRREENLGTEEALVANVDVEFLHTEYHACCRTNSHESDSPLLIVQILRTSVKGSFFSTHRVKNECNLSWKSPVKENLGAEEKQPTSTLNFYTQSIMLVSEQMADVAVEFLDKKHQTKFIPNAEGPLRSCAHSRKSIAKTTHSYSTAEEAHFNISRGEGNASFFGHTFSTHLIVKGNSVSSAASFLCTCNPNEHGRHGAKHLLTSPVFEFLVSKTRNLDGSESYLPYSLTMSGTTYENDSYINNKNHEPQCSVKNCALIRPACSRAFCWTILFLSTRPLNFGCGQTKEV